MNVSGFRPLAVLPLLWAASCQQVPQSPQAAAIRMECRQTVERQYNAQNRVDLTRRDERDQPFANAYNEGISSRGLSQAYQRDQMVDDCLRASGTAPGALPGTGPAFNPAGGPGSTLSP